MSGNSSIEWTNKTWGPTRGCSRVSAGCVHCYAETFAARYSNYGTKPDSPFFGFVTKVNGHASWTGKVELIESLLDAPTRWRKPARVFVNSMSDLFHEALPDEAIDRIFAVMEKCPQHEFQILTKRPKNMLRVVTEMYGQYASHWNSWPLPNVWLGVSCENQATADERVPLLLQTPAAIRFVSYEPALGPVDFAALQPNREVEINALNGTHGVYRPLHGANAKLDWIIVGGESGPHARPFDLKWARTTVAQCKAAEVACFVKQFGANPIYRPEYPNGNHKGETVYLELNDRNGGEMSEWPEDLRVREFPLAKFSDAL